MAHDPNIPSAGGSPDGHGVPQPGYPRAPQGGYPGGQQAPGHPAPQDPPPYAAPQNPYPYAAASENPHPHPYAAAPPAMVPMGGVAAPSPAHPLALTSMLLGIGAGAFGFLGLFLGILIPLAFLAAVGAVVTGHIARSQIKRTGREGGGMALTGIIIGYAVAALCILLFLLAIGLGVFLGMTGRL